MNKAKKELLNGTITYFIGNALISLVQLVLLRFVTGKLLPEDYGYYNLIVTIDQLITPLVTLQISDAVFRFFFKDDKPERETVYTNAIVVLVVGFIIVALGCLVFNMFMTVNNLFLVICYMISTNIFATYQKVTRAMGYSVDYVKCSFIKSILYILIQMICLYVFDLKVQSLFIAVIASTIISMLLLEFKIKQYKYFNPKMFNSTKLKEMLKFSLPLVPNTIFWWLNASVNSMILISKLGLEANGIYTVSGKFANALNIVTSVFAMAWQESAIKEEDSKTNENFYSDIFDLYFKSMFLIVAMVIPIIKVLMPHMIAVTYYEALLYAPIPVVAAGFSAMAGFFGQMYAATKETKGAMYTNLFGMIINLSVTILGVRYIKVFAPIVAVLLSSTTVSIIRFVKFKAYMNIKLKIKDALLCIGAVVASLICYYCCSNVFNIVYFVLLSVFVIILYKNVIVSLSTLVLKKIKK